MDEIIIFYCPFCAKTTRFYQKQNPLGLTKQCKACQNSFVLDNSTMSPPSTPGENLQSVTNHVVNPSGENLQSVTSYVVNPSVGENLQSVTNYVVNPSVSGSPEVSKESSPESSDPSLLQSVTSLPSAAVLEEEASLKTSPQNLLLPSEKDPSSDNEDESTELQKPQESFWQLTIIVTKSLFQSFSDSFGPILNSTGLIFVITGILYFFLARDSPKYPKETSLLDILAISSSLALIYIALAVLYIFYTLGTTRESAFSVKILALVLTVVTLALTRVGIGIIPFAAIYVLITCILLGIAYHPEETKMQREVFIKAFMTFAILFSLYLLLGGDIDQQSLGQI